MSFLQFPSYVTKTLQNDNYGKFLLNKTNGSSFQCSALECSPDALRHRFKFDEFNHLYFALYFNGATIFHQDDKKQ